MGGFCRFSVKSQRRGKMGSGAALGLGPACKNGGSEAKRVSKNIVKFYSILPIVVLHWNKMELYGACLVLSEGMTGGL